MPTAPKLAGGAAPRAVGVNELVEMARFVAQTVPRLPADSQRKLVALALAVPAAQIAVADAETESAGGAVVQRTSEIFVFDLAVVAEHAPAALVRLFELASRERARVSTPRA